MGGFEGGDEGGFWDEDTTLTYIDKHKSKSKDKNQEIDYIKTADSTYSIKAHARVNVFIKKTGCISSPQAFIARCVRIETLYNTVSFVPSICKRFTIEGCDDTPLEENTIYQAYKALDNLDVEEFFTEHKVVVTKNIPLNSGLAGNASNVGAFLRLVKEVCNLVVSKDELLEIGRNISNKVPFFIYNYSSANVSGFGEIVEEFIEDAPDFELYTPDPCKHIHKNSALVNESIFSKWQLLDSTSILNEVADHEVLNDFYKPSKTLFKIHSQVAR